MKKGEVHQVFTYMMVIIVVGAVMLIGYKSIYDIIEKKCEVDSIDFKSDLVTLLDANSYYNYFAEKALRVPCDYEEICFVNKTVGNAQNTIVGQPAYNAIRQAYLADDSTNIYMIKGRFAEPLMVYEGLLVDNSGLGFFCANATGGDFKFTIRGMARGKVLIGPAGSGPLNNNNAVI